MRDRSESTDDPYDLDRFVRAQAADFDSALSEIDSGQKRTHWMWYIFPQIDGLALSPTSRYYAIKGRDEAQAYLNHPVLGPRLLAVAEAAMRIEGKSANQIFGSPDDLKLKSCATLFADVSSEGSVFHRILDRYFHGERDERTIEILGRDPS
jgi:uncharacterized protein (DUF1810 family)